MTRDHVVRNEENEILKAGGVIVDSGKVLLVTGLQGTVWSFPKGHVEHDETVEQAALREVLEETGYEVEIVKRLVDLTYTNKETGDLIRVAMFKMKTIKDTGLKEKDVQVKWFPIEEAKEFLSYHKPSSLLVEMKD
jgi:ADP-ribose pyrophosphatase YjhB (NUDIX family)